MTTLLFAVALVVFVLAIARLGRDDKGQGGVLGGGGMGVGGYADYGPLNERDRVAHEEMLRELER